MNKKSVLIAVIILVVGVFGLLGGSQVINTGSAPISESYLSTTTKSTSASASVSWTACRGNCQLGSITVSQLATAGWVRVWDATTTATSTYIETTPFSSSTYAVAVGRPIVQILGSSDVAGTYHFDTDTTYGIVVETSTGFDGQYQVLYKK